MRVAAVGGKSREVEACAGSREIKADKIHMCENNLCRILRVLGMILKVLGVNSPE